VYIPLRIAAASRIAARCQSSVASATINIALYALTDNAGLAVYGRATTYGASTADSGGVSVDPGATPDTKGSPSEITASCTNAVNYAVLCFGNQDNTAETEGTFLVDLRTGADPGTTVQADLPLYDSAALDIKMPAAYGFPVEISSSTRIAVAAQCSMNNATDRLFDVVVIGFDQLEDVGGGGTSGGGPLVGGRLA
jgi:hypothetical protein